jgi:hypothetical protein
MTKYNPPTPEQWERLPRASKIYIYLIVLRNCCIPKLRGLPGPIHYSIVSTLCMFLLLPLMPHHPITIPTVIGGGLAGGLLFMVKKYVSETEK